MDLSYNKQYYELNKDRLRQLAREYHYKHRDKYNAYSKEYYAINRDTINAKRRLHRRIEKCRPRAHLIKENKTSFLEDRRKTYQEICLTPKPPDQTSSDVYIPNFTVCFD